MPYDWSLLSRYLPVARRRASQAEIYLSRGCPYDCSFCMERAKRDTAWRALEPGEAVEELHRLDDFLDLSGWTLRVTDPLFGMKRAWRRSFLEELVRRPVRARKTWLLIRLDLVEREDLELMSRANAAPGFGLESGDPEQLRRIRKTGMLSGYLDKMLQVADWARAFRVPFGANIIVGHPGETEQSLRTSARYMERLFLDPRGTYGFLSVDPFRLYPGSPIADQLGEWQQTTGMFAHRYPWWEDGDQAFLSEWIDPSDSLTYQRREELTQQLFAPIVRGVRQNFAYDGPSRDYFERALDREVDGFSERARRQRLELLGLWSSLLPGARAPTESLGDSTAQRGTDASADHPPALDDHAEPARAKAWHIQRGPTWASAVFHVLAHVDAGSMPASVHDPRYIEHCAEILGDAAARPLGARVERLAALITSHAQYASLQTLAALFDDASTALDALAHSECFPNAITRYLARGPAAQLLLEAVQAELPHWTQLPRLQYDPTLNAELERVAELSPWLRRVRIEHLDSLQHHGRLMGQVIWVGTPCRQLGVSAERVALQAAHEALVAELTAQRDSTPEREIERLALELLHQRRQRAAATAKLASNRTL